MGENAKEINTSLGGESNAVSDRPGGVPVSTCPARKTRVPRAACGTRRRGL